MPIRLPICSGGTKRMALHLSGHKDQELLVIKTKELDLIIKGKPVHPTVDRLSLHQDAAGDWKQAELHITSLGEFLAEVFDPFAYGSKTKYFEGNKVFPCFYENQTYELIIQDKTKGQLKFYHENKNLRAAVDYVAKSKVMTGNLNFRNDIGYSELQVWNEKRLLLSVRTEVFPAKIEYRSDYLTLLTEVNAELYNLAFDFMRKTYLSATTTPSTKPSLTEFFSIIRYCFDRLCKAIKRIEGNPHHIVTSRERISHPEKVKRINGKTLKWLSKNQSLLKKSNRGIGINDQTYLPERVLEHRKVINFDTFENRFIKWVLTSIGNKLKYFERTYREAFQDKEAYDTDIGNRIGVMQNKINRIIKFTFLADIGDLHRLDSLSLVLQMAPGYREVYKYYLMLTKGLSLQSDVFNISVKDIALLYEYWCFLKLNSILRSKYQLDKHDLIRVTNKGLKVELDKSKRANIHYTNPRNGEKIVLAYNNLLNRKMPTTKQRPDNMLALRKENSETRYQYVFDAKYRLNPAMHGSRYYESYGKPGPEEDDINTMHRYRDAIMYYEGQDFNKTVFGAFILFPLKDGDSYAGSIDGQPHLFYSSIEEVNIGGLPFLPGETNLVERFLEELIVDSSDSAFERAVTQAGTGYYYREKFDPKTVLVGALKNKEQLKVNLENKFYHIPYEQVKKTCFNIKYVALYQSEKQFSGSGGISYYGEVKDMEVLKRQGITEIPKDSEHLYVKFTVKEWQQLDNVIKPVGYGVRSHIYTTLYLLQRATELPELSLKSEEEIRLWKELKRIVSSLKICPDAKELRSDINPSKLVFEDISIEIDQGKGLVATNGRDEQEIIPIEMLQRNPRHAVKTIIQFSNKGQ